MIFKNLFFALAVIGNTHAESKHVFSSDHDDESMSKFNDVIYATFHGSVRGLKKQNIGTLDGEVNKDVVIKALASLTKDRDGHKAYDTSCAELLLPFDKNEDGFLDVDELVAVFMYPGIIKARAKKLAKEFLTSYDRRPKDGRLNKREIKRVCKGD